MDLKPLTIFMGRSNTGKSYMAAAVYALMTASYEDEFGPSFRTMGRGRSRRQVLGRPVGLGWSRDMPEEVRLALRDWARAQMWGRPTRARLQYPTCLLKYKGNYGNQSRNSSIHLVNLSSTDWVRPTENLQGSYEGGNNEGTHG